MMPDQTLPACVHCGRTSQDIPLIRLQYREESYWICPSHLPILIHKPGLLTGKLPGAENLGDSEGHDH